MGVLAKPGVVLVLVRTWKLREMRCNRHVPHAAHVSVMFRVHDCAQALSTPNVQLQLVWLVTCVLRYSELSRVHTQTRRFACCAPRGIHATRPRQWSGGRGGDCELESMGEMQPSLGKCMGAGLVPTFRQQVGTGCWHESGPVRFHTPSKQKALLHPMDSSSHFGGWGGARGVSELRGRRMCGWACWA